MNDLSKIQQAFTQTRNQKSETDNALQKAKAAYNRFLINENQSLKGLDKEMQQRSKAANDSKRKELLAKIEHIAQQKNTNAKNVENLAADFLQQFDPVANVEKLNDAYPILLFPLRLEIRFKATGNQPQLWIRVYPDDCNINKKEELLSDSELSGASSFWIEIWKAGGIESEERGAWKSLVNSFGSGRAAWIIDQFKPLNEKPAKPDTNFKILVINSSLVLADNEKTAARDYWAAVWLANGDTTLQENALAILVATTDSVKATSIAENYIPVNLTDEIPSGITNEQVLLSELQFPSDDDFVTTQVSWTNAPKAMALPDKFVVIAYKGNDKRIELFENPVKENLAVGPDPSLGADEQIKKDNNGDMIVNEELRWMVDFDKAVTSGMGTRINLDSHEAMNGFDKLFVVGLRFSSDEIQSKTELEKLLTDHFHSKEGFGLLKQGTPTNNTEDLPAGYSWTDDADESYNRIFGSAEAFTETTEINKRTDGQKLADALGIDLSSLQSIPNAAGSDQLEATAMNTALFPATLGYFMEEMMHPLFSEDDIEDTRLFFTEYVSGRGPLPAIRIGKQPYGILPVSVYSKMKFSNKEKKTGKISFEQRLHSLVMKIDQAWDTMVSSVSYVGKEGDSQQILLDVIGLHANSVEFHQRYIQSIQQLHNQLVLASGSSMAEIVALAFAERSKIILQDLGIKLGETTLPVLEKYFLSEPNLLSGAVIDDVPLSETESIRDYSADGKNYIEWLATVDADTIRLENFGGNSEPEALLYLLLRHSLMQTQSDAGTQVLFNNRLIPAKQAYHDPAFINVEIKGKGKSKFEHLYNPLLSVTGRQDRTLVEHLYLPAILRDAPETKKLRETLAALDTLKNTPTARLERLLAEHLDCCNYRIDAWKTGLVQYRLTEQRKHSNQNTDSSKGIYLGAYGCLLEVRPGKKILTDVELPAELSTVFNKNGKTQMLQDNTNLGYIHAPSLNQAAAAAILRNTYDSNKNAGSGNPFAINLTSDRVRIANNFLEGIRNGQSLSALLGYQFERGLHDKFASGEGEVDLFIYPLRKAFPLVADNMNDTISGSSDPVDTIQANNVIDGLKLINYVTNAAIKKYPFGLTGLPVANQVQADAIDAEVTKIENINDAISDLVIAEQVYQVVQSNFERVSGNADAFSKGGYPPNMDIADTPRSGITLTHKFVIHFDATAASDKSPYFNETLAEEILPMTPRAIAEPAINKWLASIFPAPENVLCVVEYSNPVIAGTRITVSQKDLGLQPIDLLYVFNLDTEQAMAELDDRICKYCRYDLSQKAGFELFNHPNTQVKINYTESIDQTDKSKISFFEMAALIKNVRKVLIGNKYLTQGELLPPTNEKAVIQLDDAQLKTRVVTLLDDLEVLDTTTAAIKQSTVSIASLVADLRTKLSGVITDATKTEEITSLLESDLKTYLTNAVQDTKDVIINIFMVNIAAISDASIADDLVEWYDQSLDTYGTDFANLDNLVKETTEIFTGIALYDNVQTGIGFMSQRIAAIYERISGNLSRFIDSWTNKSVAYESLMTAYESSTIPEEQFSLLQKAEKSISPGATFPMPLVLADYELIVRSQKIVFDTLFAKLVTCKNNPVQTITAFMEETESAVKELGNFDVTEFDVDKKRNDLYTEKMMLISLKEEMVVALENLTEMLEEKIAAGRQLVIDADSTSNNTDKITSLQNAAKKVIGDEALLLPLFLMEITSANEFEHCFQNSESILDFVSANEHRIFPVEDWLGGVSRVRDRLHHWENAGFLSNAFNPGTTIDVKPLQFPFTENDRWAAMKFRTDDSDTFKINHDKLLYTAHFASGMFDKTASQCGIVIDEWVEVIPASQETTGIAFHYDQPNSEPPQTMLLVTPVELTGNWQWEELIGAIEETIDMAKKRAVEPAQVENSNYAQFLPATMIASTLHQITVATNLARNNNIYQFIQKD